MTWQRIAKFLVVLFLFIFTLYWDYIFAIKLDNYSDSCGVVFSCITTIAILAVFITIIAIEVDKNE